MHSKNRGIHALYESTQKSMNSAYSLMTMDRDLEDRPVCITCKQSVSVKNGYTSKLFTRLRM